MRPAAQILFTRLIQKQINIFTLVGVSILYGNFSEIVYYKFANLEDILVIIKVLDSLFHLWVTPLLVTTINS